MIALVATVIWSTTGIFISYLSKTYSLPSLVLAFWRDLFVSFGMVVGLLVFSRARFQLEKKHWGFMVLYGLTLAIFNSMWTFSVQYNGAAVATVMAFSSPAMTAILSKIVFKEHFSRIKIFSILLSLAGIVFVSGAHDPATWNLNPLGIIFGLISGLMFAIYNLEGKHASDTHIDSWTALLYSFAFATVFLLFFNLGNDLLITRKPPFADMLWLGSSISGWGLLFFLGVAPNDPFAQGLAHALRERWPALYKDFRHYCQTTHPKPGELWAWMGAGGVRIVSLFTQEGAEGHHGGRPGRASLSHVGHALKALHKLAEKEKFPSLALPRIATGVGGLDWSDVRPLVEQHLGSLAIPVYVYSKYVPGVAARETG